MKSLEKFSRIVKDGVDKQPQVCYNRIKEKARSQKRKGDRKMSGIELYTMWCEYCMDCEENGEEEMSYEQWLEWFTELE